jgi:hypothetical protein
LAFIFLFLILQFIMEAEEEVGVEVMQAQQELAVQEEEVMDLLMELVPQLQQTQAGAVEAGLITIQQVHMLEEQEAQA